MNYINNLGEFDSLADVWKEYPYGGKEGDYVVINGVNVAWNKYTTNWGADTEMPDVNNEVNGDFIVKRDLRVGGEIINKDLKWIKEATVLNKGYFKTVDDLKRSYPAATAGSKAYVGSDYHYAIYLWDGKNAAWVDSGEYFDNSLRNKGYFATVEALQAAYPIAVSGSKAYVGVTYPYAIYLWDAATSAWMDSGETGGEESVDLGDYYTKEETDEKVAELESELISSYIEGKGNVFVDKKLTSLIPTKSYRILIDANTSDVEGTSGYRFKLEVFDSNNASLGVLAYTAMGKALKEQYDITIPNGAAYATIGGRFADGDLFRYTITPLLGKSEEDIYLEKDKSIQIYVDSASSVTIEENINKGYLFISYTRNLNIRRSGQVLWSGTIQELATLLGLDLVTSTKGVADCIQMATQTILAVDSASDKPVIIQRDKLTLQYTPIIANFAGQCVYIAQGIYNAVDAVKVYEPDIIRFEKLRSTNVWVDSTSKVVIEENTNYGMLYFTYTLELVVRRSGQVLWIGTIQDLATLLGLGLTTSKQGVINCIEISSNQFLVFNVDTESLQFVQRDKLSNSHIPILCNMAGQCVYVAQGVYNAIDALKGKNIIMDDIKKNTFVSSYCDVDVKAKADEYSALLNDSSVVENYLFMTDQHYGESDGNDMNTELMRKHINIIEKFYNSTPTDFVLSGGDWLNKGDTKEQACAKLGFIDGIMNAKFRKYYPILGNHDTNNQGIAYEGAAAYSGVLSNETIANLWFRNWGKNYYDFQTARVHWIILDTQHDFAPKMNEYKWQQVAWLGERLKSNSYSNVVIAFHIYWQQESNNEISPITDNALNMSAAFNNKTTITLNGVTYDFSQTQGIVRCAICGHSHKDFNLIHNGIPVIATDRIGSSEIPTFDLVCLDFTNKKFKSIRVGNGENRIIDIL